MRAREFVLEARRSTVPDHFRHASPGALGPAGRDSLYTSRSNDFYRMSVLAGMDPEDLEKMDTHSWIDNRPMYNAYTDHDHDKIQRAMKKMGHRPISHAPQGSREMPDVSKISPIRAFRGYR